jgi:hypothetical protein
MKPPIFVCSNSGWISEIHPEFIRNSSGIHRHLRSCMLSRERWLRIGATIMNMAFPYQGGAYRRAAGYRNNQMRPRTTRWPTADQHLCWCHLGVNRRLGARPRRVPGSVPSSARRSLGKRIAAVAVGDRPDRFADGVRFQPYARGNKAGAGSKEEPQG